MTYSFRQMEDRDVPAVLGVFNHYVEHSFAAFPEIPVGKEFADHFMKAAERYPVLVVECSERYEGTVDEETVGELSHAPVEEGNSCGSPESDAEQGGPSGPPRVDGPSVVGFGFVHQYYPLTTLDRTGLVGYFIHPDHCGRGIGTRLLEELVAGARERGIDNLIAMASARNEGSVRFHLRNGFREVGRFEKVARKFNRDVDQVWFQRFI